MSQYLGIDVLDIKIHNRSEPLDEAVRRSFALIDSETGKRKPDERTAAPNPARPFHWTCFSRAEVNAMQTFLDARRGMAVPFWLPSYQQDLSLNEAAVETETILTIDHVRYAQLMFPNTGARRHIAIYARGQAMFFRKIVDAQDPVDNTTESVTVDSGLPRDLPIDTTVISFLKLCRLDEDGWTISWLSGHTADTVIRVREVPKEAPQ